MSILVLFFLLERPYAQGGPLGVGLCWPGGGAFGQTMAFPQYGSFSVSVVWGVLQLHTQVLGVSK